MSVDKEFPSHAWPGGYPVVYLDGDNETLCGPCARESQDEDIERFRACEQFVFFEGPSIFCSECNQEIESAYGDPDEDEDENS